jgi:hypothetical protein
VGDRRIAVAAPCGTGVSPVRLQARGLVPRVPAGCDAQAPSAGMPALGAWAWHRAFELQPTAALQAISVAGLTPHSPPCPRGCDHQQSESTELQAVPAHQRPAQTRDRDHPPRQRCYRQNPTHAACTATGLGQQRHTSQTLAPAAIRFVRTYSGAPTGTGSHAMIGSSAKVVVGT